MQAYVFLVYWDRFLNKRPLFVNLISQESPARDIPFLKRNQLIFNILSSSHAVFQSAEGATANIKYCFGSVNWNFSLPQMFIDRLVGRSVGRSVIIS